MKQILSINKVFLMIIGRLLFGYLIYQATNQINKVESLIVSSNNLQDDTICTYDNIVQKIDETIEKDNDKIKQVAEELFLKCRRIFLDKNQVSPVIKITIDKWLNVDSNATAEERWEAVALMSNEPLKIEDKEFVNDCLKMGRSYELYQDNTSLLSDYINIQDNFWLTGKQDDDNNNYNNSINNGDTRELINYAQYSLFCSIMISLDEY